MGVFNQSDRFIMTHRIIMRHYQEVQVKQDYHEFVHASLQGYHELMITR